MQLSIIAIAVLLPIDILMILAIPLLDYGARIKTQRLRGRLTWFGFIGRSQ